MRRSPQVLLALSLALTVPLGAACTKTVPSSASGEAQTAGTSGAGGEAEGEAGAEDRLAALRRNVAETAARQELDVERLRVAHILVSFAGVRGLTATRSKAEAEQLAADLLARIEAGEDFMELMRAHSDDTGDGVYGMTAGAPSSDFMARQGMVAAFGNTGYRLEVGQVGVAAYHPEDSPYGWHIITRLE
jgi:parvulin-like peptidyl-prolyl isomerase